jgi:hypothetical protein
MRGTTPHFFSDFVKLFTCYKKWPETPRMARKGRPIASRTNDPGSARSLYELADKLGASYNRVVRLRKDGLEPEADGSFSVPKALWFLKQRNERSSQHPNSAAAVTWKERRIKALALTAETDLAERTKQLVLISEVRTAWGLQATKIKNAFKGLGRQLAPLLLQRGPQEIQAIIDRRVLEILNDLSHKEYHSQKPNITGPIGAPPQKEEAT